MTMGIHAFLIFGADRKGIALIRYFRTLWTDEVL